MSHLEECEAFKDPLRQTKQVEGGRPADNKRTGQYVQKQVEGGQGRESQGVSKKAKEPKQGDSAIDNILHGPRSNFEKATNLEFDCANDNCKLTAEDS